ncbi:MAG: DivIVA domain-containing protein [Fibrobacter sp.]|nr:DivIVA domain-containing protein [Fibrobacter sp.]
MDLTPLDVRNQSFRKKTLGGLDPEEVSAFLNQVATDMEKQARARTELTERLKIAEERVNYYKLIEKTLQDSVVTMQKTTDEAKFNAEREAELIIAEAKARALREVEETKKNATDLRAEIEVLKQQRTNYFIRIRALLRSQEELLEAMELEQHGEDGLNAELTSTEAMAFRNKRMEQTNQKKTGSQTIVPPRNPRFAQKAEQAVNPSPWLEKGDKGTESKS